MTSSGRFLLAACREASEGSAAVVVAEACLRKRRVKCLPKCSAAMTRSLPFSAGGEWAAWVEVGEVEADLK